MKKKFSKSWKSSKQPRKQRKYVHNIPLHLKKKLLSATLSKELRKKYQKRNVTIKPGDKVKVLRGGFKGKFGEVTLVDRPNLKIHITGIENIKKDGSKAPYPINSSNVMITELKLDDKNRVKSLERNIQKTITKENKNGKTTHKKNSSPKKLADK